MYYRQAQQWNVFSIQNNRMCSLYRAMYYRQAQQCTTSNVLAVGARYIVRVD